MQDSLFAQHTAARLWKMLLSILLIKKRYFHWVMRRPTLKSERFQCFKISFHSKLDFWNVSILKVFLVVSKYYASQNMSPTIFKPSVNICKLLPWKIIQLNNVSFPLNIKTASWSTLLWTCFIFCIENELFYFICTNSSSICEFQLYFSSSKACDAKHEKKLFRKIAFMACI